MTILFCFVCVYSNAQTSNTLPFYDNMDYSPVGANLFPNSSNTATYGTWYTQDPRSSTVQTIAASPTWSLTSNVETPSGNALSTSTFGEDPELFFTQQTSGEVFVSMFLQVGSSFSSNLNTTSLDRIFEISEGTSSAASVFVRGVLDGGGTTVIGIEFGINEDASATDASDVNWTGVTHSANEQLFLVFSYTKNSSTDTAAKLWINPVVDGTEPAADVEDTTTKNRDVTNFSFNVRNSTHTPTFITDEFRIGNSWNDVAPVKGSTGSGAVDPTITTATTPTFPVYESFDNYATGTILIPANSETGIGAWATKDQQTTHDFTVVDSPTWGTTGTDTGVNNSGKAVQFEGSREDAYLQFTEQSGSFGTIYASFLMKVTDITNINTTPARLVGFGTLNSGGTVSGASHLYISKDADNTSAYNIGINEDNGFSDTPEFVGGATPTEYTENQELLVVIYFDDTNTTSTTAKIWVNPTVGTAEPAPDATDGPRNLNASFLIFSQSNSSSTPDVTFDEIRIASTWDEVTNVKHTWTGGTADWATASNWDNSIVPTALSNVVIPSGATNQPVIGATTGAILHNLSIDAAADLSISSGGSLQSTGNVTGDFTYNLTIADDEWHLVSSPVIGEEYDDVWVTANGIASGTENNRGISTYDNSSSDGTTGHWRYMQQGDSEVFQRQGYALKRTAAGSYAFTGTFPRYNFEIPISQNNGNNWNLVNNPYPSYVSIADLIANNTANLGAAFQSIYVWNPSNGTNGAYEILTSGHVHPGQAFFVNSNVSTGTLDITESVQSSQTGVTFYRPTSSASSITLKMNLDASELSTTFDLLEDATNGLDPGQDFGMFTGVEFESSIYSVLVEGDTGIPLGIQSLTTSNLDEIEISIGVKAEKDSELTFTAESLNLPTGVSVILEDRLTNTFTDLSDPNTDYTVMITEDINGIGRFYLSTSAEALSTDEIDFENIHIFKTAHRNLRITGLSEGNYTFKLYNILGKQMLNTSFVSNSQKDITLPSVSTGIYIVELTTENGKLNKKIVLE